jgi:hypothetical protein
MWETPNVTKTDGITDACKPVFSWMIKFFGMSHTILINFSLGSSIITTFHLFFWFFLSLNGLVLQNLSWHDFINLFFVKKNSNDRN